MQRSSPVTVAGQLPFLRDSLDIWTMINMRTLFETRINKVYPCHPFPLRNFCTTKIKKPIPSRGEETGFTALTSTLHLLYSKKYFQHTLQAGLLTSGSSYWLRLPGNRFISLTCWDGLPVVFATFVPGYSGGTVPVTPDFWHEELRVNYCQKLVGVGIPFSSW